jgi:hypothetical protein
MSIIEQIGQANRSLSRDSAATDYTRYVKTQAVRSWWFHRHGMMLDELQLASAVKGVSSRLQKMFEIRPETIDGVTKKIMDNVAVGLPNDMHRKAAVIEGGHVREPPKIIDCQNDEAAVKEAKQLLDGKLIEV